MAAMPAPGAMVALSAPFAPPLLKGVKVYANNPFRLDFILDKGTDPMNVETENLPSLRNDATRLIKYFLSSVTVPEKDLWVNLSPYEKNRIVPDAFGVTEMGRDLLAQDYMLKQITASVIYPEGETGKVFWAEVYKRAQEKFGTTDIPIDTFNKVWIVPAKAVVYEGAGTACRARTKCDNTVSAAYVVDSRLKVMLDSDYTAMSVEPEYLPALRGSGMNTEPQNIVGRESAETQNIAPLHNDDTDTKEISKEVLREIVIPILEKEVNEGKNFAQLRQVYNSLILAVWYKDKVRGSLLGKAYVDQKNTGGVDISDRNEKEKIWAQYVEAFKKGAYNYIKEDVDQATQQPVPRKYFSGGVVCRFPEKSFEHTFPTPAQLSKLALDSHDPAQNFIVQTNLDAAAGSESVKTPGIPVTLTGDEVARMKAIEGDLRNVFDGVRLVDVAELLLAGVRRFGDLSVPIEQNYFREFALILEELSEFMGFVDRLDTGRGRSARLEVLRSNYEKFISGELILENAGDSLIEWGEQILNGKDPQSMISRWDAFRAVYQQAQPLLSQLMAEHPVDWLIPMNDLLTLQGICQRLSFLTDVQGQRYKRRIGKEAVRYFSGEFLHPVQAIGQALRHVVYQLKVNGNFREENE